MHKTSPVQPLTLFYIFLCFQCKASRVRGAAFYEQSGPFILLSGSVSFAGVKTAFSVSSMLGNTFEKTDSVSYLCKKCEAATNSWLA